jgi:hypothetical protein
MRLIASSLLLCLMTVTGAGGCARAPRANLAVQDVKALTGSWQGWLVTERDFTLVRFDIHEDGTFEVTGPRIRATGSLTLVGGLVRFSGTGLWQGCLTPTPPGGGRALKLERDDRLYRGTLRRARDSLLPTSGNLR